LKIKNVEKIKNVKIRDQNKKRKNRFYIYGHKDVMCKENVNTFTISSAVAEKLRDASCR